MKHLTKKAVVSLVATSVILTSFTANANDVIEKPAKVESSLVTSSSKITQSASSKTADGVSNTNKSVDDDGTTEQVTTEDNKSSVTKESTKPTAESKEHSDYSFCIGDCESEEHESYHCDDEDDDCKDFKDFNSFIHNRRDGFYFDVSAISSFGDDYYSTTNESDDTEFDVAISYRIQLLGLFMESPGISTRRIQGMYSLPAWGVNFYNSEDYSFDLFYQYSTRGIEGLEGIQTRNEDERAGFRMTGFYENSQLQMIYSPVSRNKEGSDGIEASISYSYNWQYRNLNYYTNLGMQYRSKEVTAYGVQTWLDDDLSVAEGISYSAEIGIEYPLTTDWVIGSYVGYNALSDRSIAARQDNVEDGVRGGLLLTFVF